MIPRSLITSDLWNNATTEQRLAIVDLYFRVAYSECWSKKYPTVRLERGQIAASQSDLERLWDMDRSKVRRTISHMKKYGFITTNLTTTGSGKVTLLSINHLHDMPDQPCDQARDQHKDNKIDNNALSEDNATPSCARGKRFVRPTADEVQRYLDEKGIKEFSGEDFCNYYDSCGWTVGRNKPMRSWHGAVQTWVRFEKNNFKKRINATETIKHSDRRAQRDAEHERIKQGIINDLMHPNEGQELPKLPF